MDRGERRPGVEPEKAGSAGILEVTPKTLEYDVVIVGGGPAGTATALSLRKERPSLSVAVLEASDYAATRIGETLPPTVQPLLNQLGVWDAFLKEEHLASYGTCSAWGSDELLDNEFIYSPHGRGWHLDRRRFDAMLAREAGKRGARIYTSCSIIGSEKSSDGVRLTAASRGRRLSMKAAFVVDATGKRAAFARAQGARKILFDLLLGAFVFFDLDKSRPLAETYTLVEAWEEGWWYSAVLPDSRIAVACMSDADIVKRRGLGASSEWLANLARTRHTSARLAHAEPAGRPSIHAAYSHRLDRVTGDCWLASGDSATAFDPLSSQGIFKALRSGVFASYAILDYFKGTRAGLEKYEEIVSREYEDYLETRMDFYGRERRWDDSEFWKRRQGRITLDPRAMLCSKDSEAGSAALERLRMHMPAGDLKALCDLCKAPRPAYEIVSAFKGIRSNSVPDRRIILALQYLIEQRVIARSES